MAGTLVLNFTYHGGFEVSNLPVVVDVLDASLETAVTPRSVRLTEGWRELLSPGTYLARVRFPSGQEIKETCTIRDRDVTRVSIDVHQLSGHESLELPAALRSVTRDEDTSSAARAAFAAAWVRRWEDTGAAGWRPVDFDGYDLTPAAYTIRYRFNLGNRPSVLQLGSPRIAWRFVSLPPHSIVDVTISPRGEDDLAVEVTTRNIQAEALLGYLRSGAIEGADLTAEPLLANAESLLRGKLADPIAAAIGGYYLLNTARLERLSDWGPNLSRWFPWLADGAVINAWQHLHAGRAELSAHPPAGREAPSGRRRSRWLQLIIDAWQKLAPRHRHPEGLKDADQHFAEMRQQLLLAIGRGIPVYTEGLKLLVDGLRLLRHDSRRRHAELDDALAFIEPYANAADWSAATVTYGGTDPASPQAKALYGFPDDDQHLVRLGAAYS